MDREELAERIDWLTAGCNNEELLKVIGRIRDTIDEYNG